MMQAFADWQFWVVTLAAVWGAWTIVKPFVPKRLFGGDENLADGTPCAHCASGATCLVRHERAEAGAAAGAVAAPAAGEKLVTLGGGRSGHGRRTSPPADADAASGDRPPA